MQIVEGLRLVVSYLKSKVGERSILSESILSYTEDQPLQDLDLVHKIHLDREIEALEELIEELIEEAGKVKSVNDVLPDVNGNVEVGIEDIDGLGGVLGDLASKSIEIATDSTLKGGGDLSANRTLGVALSKIPDTIQSLPSGVNIRTTYLTPGFYHPASDSVVSTANGYPINSGIGRTGVLIVNRIYSSDTTEYYSLLFHTRDRLFITGNFRNPISGAVSSNGPWVEFANYNNVVKKAGDTMVGTLSLAQGTTTTSPVKIPTGTLTTVPQDGAIERDADGDYFVTKGTVRSKLATVQSNVFVYTPTGNFTISEIKLLIEGLNRSFNDCHIIVELGSNNYTCQIDLGVKNFIFTMERRGNGSMQFTSTRTLNSGEDAITILNGNESSMALIDCGTTTDFLKIRNF